MKGNYGDTILNYGIQIVALTALREGASLEFVMKITGLSKEELLEMQKKLQQ